ncbi:hypothetical protein BGX31_008716 [Mortierella sp. GBA43]|nr:hypothetical protein BGX31_008716 [Mortierella sp. GBA43]
MRFSDFLSDGVALYVSHVLHPSRIPGSDLISKVYAMGVLPVLIIALTVIQWSIGLLVIVVNHTRVGAHYYDVFFKDQIALFDETDFVDPEGNDEAVRQLVDRTPRQTTHFSYHIANMLLIMSSMSYQRDDKLVAEASKILANCKTPEQRDEAARLLQESERLIDENASREFGMRFMGISELKTLGGPFAGLFYNDDTIVLVYKGTSVLAFNEYLLDVTIQRVDASEYLYGEVHKGFYESLFPDPIPQNWYESMTYDQTNPFKTIMETIFDVAKAGKSKTGKPVNLWLTGHSLGGALAALTMARLQMVVKEEDPLMNKDKDNDDITSEKPHGLGVRTVLEEMLARYSNDPDLLVLRDCYTVASPKVGDSIFADEFARNHLHYCAQSPYKSTYWRLVADKDVVPRLPPGFNADPNDPTDHIFPFNLFPSPKEWYEHAKRQDEREGCAKISKHMHSLLDYQHVGQFVTIYNAKKIPKAGPSAFEANLCEGVLRSKNGLYKLMEKIARLADSVEDPIDDNVETRSSSSTVSTGSTKTTTTTTTTTSSNTAVSCNEEQRIRAAAAKQLSDDIAKAHALYDLDELSRLRQPGLLESILLKIPSFLSHAPVTYQRNLVRGRFYVKSFPGIEFEKRLDQWLAEAKASRPTQLSDDEQQIADLDIGVNHSTGKKTVSRTTTRTVKSKSYHTVSMLRREE